MTAVLRADFREAWFAGLRDRWRCVDDGGTMTRPRLFIDCDGVVSPLPPRDYSLPSEVRFAVPDGYMTWPDALYAMHVDKRLPEWAWQLDAAFDVVWATSWERHVLSGVAEPLGLPEWPVLTLPFQYNNTGLKVVSRGRAALKAAAIHWHLMEQPRPFVWADDDLYRRVPPPPVRDLALEHLLIKPRHTIGLTQDHIDQMLAFAREHESRGSGG